MAAVRPRSVWPRIIITVAIGDLDIFILFLLKESIISIVVVVLAHFGTWCGNRTPDA